jgi:DNA invertase Pin-like site-specific DNA recombinase
MPRRQANTPDDVIERLLATAASPSKRASLTTLTAAGERSIAARTRPLRVAAYCRYSSIMQNDGWSIPMQREAFEDKARELLRDGMGWEIEYFIEPARSAKGEELAKRTVFLEMLRAALTGAFDLVAVYKLDRFSRSEIVTLLALQELERAGVGFMSLREQFDVTTPSGWIALRLHITLAEKENRDRGASIADGKRSRVMDGLYACRVPFGYRKSAEAVREALERMAEDPRGATKAIGHAPAEPDIGGSWEGLMRIYELMRACLTDYEVAEAMNAEGRWRPYTPGGGRKAGGDGVWTRQAISWIRRNPFYRPFTQGDARGTVVTRGQGFRGTHAAALTWEEWNALQRIASGRRRGWLGYASGRRKEPYTAEFRGLAVCSECGGALYVRRTIHDKAKDGRVRVYERYVCSASDRGVECRQNGKWARVEDVRAAWVEWLRAHPLDPDWEDLLRARAIQLGRYGDQGATPDKVRDRAAQLAKLRRQEQAIIHLYADGEIERAEYERRLSTCREQLSRLESAGATAKQHTVRLVDAARVMQEAVRLWPRMTLAEQQSAAARMVEPRGLPIRLLASKGYTNKWTDHSTLPPSCALGDVILKPACREMIETATLASAQA